MSVPRLVVAMGKEEDKEDISRNEVDSEHTPNARLHTGSL